MSPFAPISSAVNFGDPAHEIIAAAKETDTDLLVIATHGRTGLKHLLLGSVAERILKEASCPVLVVQEHGRGSIPAPSSRAATLQLRKILLPTDFSSCSAGVLRYAETFARQLGGKITLLHRVHVTHAAGVAENNGTSATRVPMEAALHEAEHEVARSLEQCLPADVVDAAVVQMGARLTPVQEFAKQGDFDLIICATHGYTGIKHGLHRSTAAGIGRHAPCPVLIIPERPCSTKTAPAH
jgi:nucleotide-binding universal stress UspA family protein